MIESADTQVTAYFKCTGDCGKKFTVTDWEDELEDYLSCTLCPGDVVRISLQEL